MMNKNLPEIVAIQIKGADILWFSVFLQEVSGYNSTEDVIR